MVRDSLHISSPSSPTNVAEEIIIPDTLTPLGCTLTYPPLADMPSSVAPSLPEAEILPSAPDTDHPTAPNSEAPTIPKTVEAAFHAVTYDKMKELLKLLPSLPVDARDVYGNSLLMHAIFLGRQKMISKLASTKNINHQNYCGETALIKAVQQPGEEPLLHVLDYHPELDIVDIHGRSAVFYPITRLAWT